jgi:site-specific recombinase XerC
MGLPAGDDVLDFRDRAILKTYLYTGVRLATACRLRVRDFHQDGDEATLTINEKGNRHRTICRAIAGLRSALASVAEETSSTPCVPVYRAYQLTSSDLLLLYFAANIAKPC